MTTDPELVDRVRRRLVNAGEPPHPDTVACALRAEVGLRGDAEVLDVVTAVREELLGLGPVAPLLDDPDVTDVLVNGPASVWVDRGRGLERTAIRFSGPDAVETLARRLAAVAGRRLDAAQPYVDARLAGGVRLHAVIPPVASDGPCISLRVPPRRNFTIDGLVAAEALTPVTAALLRAVVAARLAFVVTGGTGAGKTTLLSTLLGLVDHRERLVIVEDSGELRPDHDHVIRLEARPPNAEGAGTVSLRELVRQALRMRPDRLVVGEIRGAEVAELLAALNTGHEGGCCTVHANDVADVPARFEALAGMAGLRRDAVHSQLAAALDVVVHIRRAGDGRRYVAAVGVVERGDDGHVAVLDAVSVASGGEVVGGPGWPQLHGLLIARGLDVGAVSSVVANR